MKLPKLRFAPFSMDRLPPLGSDGVYVIREGRRIVYVGESHSGRLRKTYLRHFQVWQGKTAGATYPRTGETLAAWAVLPTSEAIDMQNELIRRLRPRDNDTGAPAPTWGEALADVIDAFNPF